MNQAAMDQIMESPNEVAASNLQYFIKRQCGHASMSVSDFLQKMNIPMSRFNGMKKSLDPLISPVSFKATNKILKIKQGSDEYYKFGNLLYTLYNTDQKKEFDNLYSKFRIKRKELKSTPELVDQKVNNSSADTPKESKGKTPKTYESIYKYILFKMKENDISKSDFETLVEMTNAQFEQIKYYGLRAIFFKPITDIFDMDKEEVTKFYNINILNVKSEKKKEELTKIYKSIVSEEPKPVSTKPVVKVIEKENLPIKKITEDGLIIPNTESKQVSIDAEAKFNYRKQFGELFTKICFLNSIQIYQVATFFDIQVSDISNMISGKIDPPKYLALRRFCEVFHASNIEADHMIELAQKGRMNTHLELPDKVYDYLNRHSLAIEAIIKASESDLEDEFWGDLIRNC